MRGSISIPNLSEVDPSRNGMKNQSSGILMKDISLEQELEIDIEEFMAENKEELTEYLQKVIDETQNPKELEQAIVYLLGTANYSETIKTAEAFKPEFPEPDLPSAEKVKGEKGVTTQEKGKAILLLDASSSMLLTVDGRVKMDIAKEAVQQFAEIIGQDSDVSLVVYGHKGSQGRF